MGRSTQQRSLGEDATDTSRIAEVVTRKLRGGEGVWMVRTWPSAEVVVTRANNEAWIERLPEHLTAAKELLAGPDAFDVLAGILVLQADQYRLPPPSREPFLDGLMAGETAAMALARLERDRPSGWLEVSVALLDGSERARKQVGGLARRVFAGKQRRNVEALGDITPAGEKLAIMLLGEGSGTRLDDARAAEECVERARAHGQTTLIALVVPVDDSLPLQIAWRGRVPDTAAA